MKVILSEMFHSIQGEGIFAGRPAFFIRLGGCPVGCVWCDTVEVWRRSKAVEYSDLLKKTISYKENAMDVVITGGEPLVHKDFLKVFVRDTCKYFETIQIETSATISPPDFLIDESKVFFNTSPKLSNSKVSRNVRINEEAMIVFSELAYKNRAIFKFVVRTEEDVLEAIEDFIKPFNLPRSSIFLMPESKDRETFIRRSPYIVELCKKYGFAFSPRLQLVIWDRATGV